MLVVFAVSFQIICCLGSAVQPESWQEKEIPCVPPQINLHFEKIKDKTRIVLADCAAEQYFDISSDVSISDVNDLQIKGNPTTIINCTKTNTKISFEKVSNLHLENLRILNCGLNLSAPSTGSVNIVSCSNVTVKGVTIERSPNTGLTLVNNRGTVRIENSTFRDNGQMWKTLERVVPFQPFKNSFNEFHARGGGMQVLVEGDQEYSSLTITDCMFFKNSASHGGGLSLVTKGEAEISISGTVFDQNDCVHGGGGLQIGFDFPGSTLHPDMVANNSIKITIEDCNISSNQAENGGGVAVFSSLCPFLFPPDTLTFSGCKWTNNSAALGLAVDIAIGYSETFAMHRNLPSPCFTDCSFVENIDRSVLSSPFIVNKPRSAFFVTGYKIEFRGRTVFKHNLASAIEATAAVLNFQANSTALFIENRGIEGAGWNLQALTTVYIHDDSYFLFKNNRATYSGGAIFAQYADKHSLFLSHSCFIQHVGEQSGPKNLTFVFKNNTAAFYNQSVPPKPLVTNLRHRGDSFWVTSLSPCITKCTRFLSIEPVPVSDALQCIGNVSFGRVNTERRQVSTAANHFTSTEMQSEDDNMCVVYVNITNNTIRRNPNYDPRETNSFEGTLHLVPGNIAKVPLRLVDDLCAEIFFLVRVQVLKSEKYMYVHQAHSVITDNHITLYGDENQNGQIQLTTGGLRAITATINVFLDECPPGFVHNRTTKACVCSANLDASEYLGIVRCSESAAFVQHGYWVGYLDIANSTRENRLATSYCPKGFCSNNTRATKEHELPSNASDDTDMYICSAHRTGLVCGRCRENHSAYYHSTMFACNSNDLCHLGWLFYLLSEIIPVTIFFLVVIALNISFTKGPLNGVIFFIQFVDTLKIKAENFIWFGQVQKFTYIYKIVYRMFCLNFFSLEPLSFCLWAGASALDLLAFRYVTIVYSLLLIIGTVALLKLCDFKFCNKYVINVRRSIIHGLSAFLVMSYSECTRVSLMILTRGTLRVGPNMQHLDNRDFAFYNGEYSFMGPEHLKYALPAIFFIVTLVSIPPILLISYPLCYKLFALLRLEESKFVQITCKILPLEKIKPLFDSIQGAFKDRYRFFAGLYFVYRLSSLVTFSISSTLIAHYTATGFQLVCMLVMHALCRPYKKSWHNVLDAFLFFNLFAVNGMAYYNYYLASTYDNQYTEIQTIAAFQTGLILLPLVYLVVYIAYCIVSKVKTVCAHKYSRIRMDTDNSNAVLQAIDSRRFEESVAETSNYRLLKTISGNDKRGDCEEN